MKKEKTTCNWQKPTCYRPRYGPFVLCKQHIDALEALTDQKGSFEAVKKQLDEGTPLHHIYHD